jgi:hypothetical protein
MFLENGSYLHHCGTFKHNLLILSIKDILRRKFCKGKFNLCCNEEKIYLDRQQQLLASLLASFPCKLNTFRNRVKNVVTSKGIEVWIECK